MTLSCFGAHIATLSCAGSTAVGRADCAIAQESVGGHVGAGRTLVVANRIDRNYEEGIGSSLAAPTGAVSPQESEDSRLTSQLRTVAVTALINMCPLQPGILQPPIHAAVACHGRLCEACGHPCLTHPHPGRYHLARTPSVSILLNSPTHTSCSSSANPHGGHDMLE